MKSEEKQCTRSYIRYESWNKTYLLNKNKNLCKKFNKFKEKIILNSSNTQFCYIVLKFKNFSENYHSFFYTFIFFKIEYFTISIY